MIMNVSLDELHSYEVIALSSVVKNQSILVRCFQLEVDVHQVVSLHLWSPEVSVVRGERDGFVYGVLQVLELHIPCSLTKLTTQLSSLADSPLPLTFILNLLEVRFIQNSLSINDQTLEATLEVLCGRSGGNSMRETSDVVKPGHHLVLSSVESH